MLLSKVAVKNYRLLNDATVDLEPVLSLVIGKNNCGKTSLLSILDKFLNKKDFAFDDLNIEVQNYLVQAIEKPLDEAVYMKNPIFISMRLYIDYDEKDNLENLSRCILDLDSSIRTVILLFEYDLSYNSYLRLIADYTAFKKASVEQDILFYLKKNHKHYFDRRIKSVEVGNKSNFIEIQDSEIKPIICFQCVGAKRGVANTDGKEGRVLSGFISESLNARNNKNIVEITDLQRKIFETDKILTDGYKVFFDKMLSSVKTFTSDAAEIQIHSTINEIDLLRDNTSVRYLQDGHNLPEHYNGLGYMNLFAILFEIHLKLDGCKKVHTATEKPADINLLFIEEPEAHTHPQMQYIFIKNIKRMLAEGRIVEGTKQIHLQTIVTTHSSHITSQSEFDDIKYFSRETLNSVKVKNLRDLKESYNDEADARKAKFNFLKKYLTLNNSELFFADKAIFIEGDSERILLPAIMKKIDTENKNTKDYIPLLSQNISIVEAGNYAHVFDKFLDFLNIKTLIITDIDSIRIVEQKGEKKDGTPKTTTEACRVKEGTESSNSSIKHFLPQKDLAKLILLKPEEKILKRNEDGSYIADTNGNLAIAYQIIDADYYPRSFEEAFISVNLDFIVKHKELFESLKNREKITENATDFYEIADSCIEKKTAFASDVLYYSKEDLSDWKVPAYFVGGLKWLTQ